MKKVKLLSLLLSFWGGTYFASETKDNSSEFEKFANTYRLPEKLESLIKKNTGFAKVICYQTQSPLLYFLGQDPSYCSKSDGIDRITNAKRMRNFIKENNLGDYLAVPKKYIYNNNGKWEVIAEGIETTDIKKFTRQELEAFIKLQDAMCYSDFQFNTKTGNVVRNAKTGKVTIVDTENRSFAGGGVTSPAAKTDCVRWLNEHNVVDDAKAKSILADRIHQDNIHTNECLQHMDCDRYADGHVECKPKKDFYSPVTQSEIQACENHFNRINFLQEAKRFDRDGIDHEQAQKEFNELKKRRRNRH